MKYWFFAFCLLIQSQVFAEENIAKKNLGAINGVWETTVNKQKFLVCWESYGTGNAYNKKNPHQLFELSASDKSDSLSWTWLDSSDEKVPLKPFLQITKIEHNKIVADVQYGLQSSKSMALKRVKTINYTGDCLFDGYQRKDKDVTMYQAFNAPRVKALKIWYSAPKTFMGKQYRINNAATQGKSKSVGEVSSLALSNDGQDLTAINKTLAHDYKDDQLSLVTCGDSNELGNGGDYQSHQQLRYWGSDWVSISYHSDGYCGGAHPFFNSDTQTFNIATGKSEDIWQWFKLTTLDKNAEVADDEKQVCRFKAQKDEYLTQCLPPKLVKKIYQARTICDKKCHFLGEKMEDFREMADGHIYSITLSPNGVSFVPGIAEPARGMRTYFAHYVIPYTELKPFLSKKGRAEISKIMLMSK